jgi:hypothetical protein
MAMLEGAPIALPVVITQARSSAVDLGVHPAIVASESGALLGRYSRRRCHEF